MMCTLPVNFGAKTIWQWTFPELTPPRKGLFVLLPLHMNQHDPMLEWATEQEPIQDKSLFERIKNPGVGLDQENYEALYQQEEKPLYNTVYRWVWDQEEALDLVQEAFVRLWRTRHKVDLNTARPLVYRIALNLASNRLRSRKLWSWTGLGDFFSSRNPERELLCDERERKVRQAVEGLPEKIRKVVILVRFADMSYKQIGELLNIPQGTVGSRYNRGIQLLETELKDLQEEAHHGH